MIKAHTFRFCPFLTTFQVFHNEQLYSDYLEMLFAVGFYEIIMELAKWKRWTAMLLRWPFHVQINTECSNA